MVRSTLFTVLAASAVLLFSACASDEPATSPGGGGNNNNNNNSDIRTIPHDTTASTDVVETAESDAEEEVSTSGEICDNQFDDDGDQNIDCLDPDCIGAEGCAPAPETACDNGIDDDDDTLFDCDDSDCRFSPACTENNPDMGGGEDFTPGTEICDNLVDDDGDTVIDCLDGDCFADPSCAQPEDCFDGQDNDGDNLIDCEDIASCEPVCDEGQSSGAGNEFLCLLFCILSPDAAPLLGCACGF